MLTFWLIGFLSGAFWGRLSDVGYVFFRPLSLAAIAAILAIWFLKPSRVSKYLFGMAGLLWGFSHSVPLALSPLSKVQVTQSTFPFGYPGSVIVKGRRGYEEVRNAAPLLSEGDVRCFNKPMLFSNSICVFRAKSPMPLKLGFVALWVTQCKTVLVQRIRWLDPELRSWLRGIILGEQKQLSLNIKTVFKDTGLYHLLIVSGFHISMIAVVISALVKVPGILAYSLRLIRPSTWIWLSPAFDIAALLAVLFFTFITGMTVASQRALLLFSCYKLAPLFLGGVSCQRRLVLAGFLQTLIFPRGFLCESSLMSWGAYLFLLDSSQTKLRDSLRSLFYLQFKLGMLFSACFGYLCLAGFVLNPLVIPLFPCLLVTGGMLFFLREGGWMANVIAQVHLSFISTLSLFHDKLWAFLGDFAFLLNVDLGEYPWLSALSCFVSGLFLLNTCKILSISREPD